MICNLGVVGSNPTRGSPKVKVEDVEDMKMGGYQSGQMGQTVNLLSFDFGGSNPSPPTSVENGEVSAPLADIPTQFKGEEITLTRK